MIIVWWVPVWMSLLQEHLGPPRDCSPQSQGLPAREGMCLCLRPRTVRPSLLTPPRPARDRCLSLPGPSPWPHRPWVGSPHFLTTPLRVRALLLARSLPHLVRVMSGRWAAVSLPSRSRSEMGSEGLVAVQGQQLVQEACHCSVGAGLCQGTALGGSAPCP